jgi:hypothetical protein
MNTYKNKTRKQSNKAKTVKRTNTSKAPLRSNSKEAKRIIRNEIREYHKDTDNARTPLDGMKMNADSYNCGDNRKHSDYAKGASYVDAGGLACYPNDQNKMLRKIYGKKVDDWSATKTHETYKHLIGREYSEMLSEREKAKAKKAEERAKAKMLKAKAKEKKRNVKKKR